MDSLSRVGMLICVIGLAGLLSMVVRSNPVVYQRELPLMPNGYDDTHLFLGPQELRVDLDAQQAFSINVYLLNSTEYADFLSRRPFQPLFAETNLTHGPFFAKITGRGPIDLVTVNNSPAPVDLTLTLTVYGLESDLLLASSLLSVSGIGLSLARYAVGRFFRNQVQNP